MVDGLIDCYYKGSFTHILFITYSRFVHNVHMKTRGKELSLVAAQSMVALSVALSQQAAAAKAGGTASVPEGLGDLDLGNFTNANVPATLAEMKDLDNEFGQEAGPSVIEATLGNKEQFAGSAGETGVGDNAKVAVRSLVAVLTVMYYYQASNITGCPHVIQYFQANKDAKEAEPSVSKASQNDKEQAAGYLGVSVGGINANVAVRHLVAVH